jgi:hypothetical protein
MGGGLKHPEADFRIPFLLSPAPLLSKLYDSRLYDGGCYQARELSYLFDHLDCQFIAWSSQAGFPHLLSVTTLLSGVLLSLAVWCFCMRDLRLGTVTTLGLNMLFLTSPVMMLSSHFFRTGKIGAALMTVLCVILLFRAYHRQPPLPARYTAGVCLGLFGLAGTAMFFDRQGVFFAGVAIVGMALLAFQRADGCRWRWLLPLPLFLALGVNGFYNRVVGTHLTWAFNGYWPSFDFQSDFLRDFVANIGRYLSEGFDLTVGTLGFFLGNLPHACVILGGGGAVGWLLWRKCRQTSVRGNSPLSAARRYVPLFLAVTIVGLVTVMNAIMACRHPPLLWPDIRLAYYWLPVAALWFVLAAVILHEFQHAVTRALPRRILQTVLFILVAGNIAALPRHRAVMHAGHLGPDMDWCAQYREVMRRPASSTEPVAPAVARNSVFQLFKYGRNQYAKPAPPIGRFEGTCWSVEILEFETNRVQYAFAAVDGEPSAARGSIVKAAPSALARSGLLGPMRLTALNGKPYRFSPKPLRQTSNHPVFFKIRVVNKTTDGLPFRVGTFVATSNGRPLKLSGVGLDKWLFDKTHELDCEGARGQSIHVPARGTQELVYAFECNDAIPGIGLHLSE